MGGPSSTMNGIPIPQHMLGDLQLQDLRCAFVNAVNSRIAEETLDPVIGDVSGAPEHLYGTVGDPADYRNHGQYVSAVAAAARQARDQGLLSADQEPLIHLLDAQTALIEGRSEDARAKFEAMAEDPDREDLSRLMLAWDMVFKGRPAMVRECQWRR